jgi:hypothetical protein
MKKILGLVIIAAGFAACTGKKEANPTQMLVPIDSFNAYKNSQAADTAKVVPVVAAPVKSSAGGTKSSQPVKSSGTTANSNQSAGSTSTGTNTTAAKKKGWSKAAQGATIGGVGGAIGGAIIGKGAKGAAVGAVIGATGGYIIGRKKDKKDGRVQ